MLLEQPCVLLRQALRHRGGVIRRDQQLPRVQARCDVVADEVFAQAALADDGEKGIAVELAVDALKRGYLHQFAVDQALACTQAVLVRVLRQRRALNHLL